MTFGPMQESLLNRLPGIIFAVLVVIAVLALLLGYGIPVGVGAVAGLVLGGIAGFFSVLWLARGAGRSMTIGSYSWSSSSSGTRTEADMDELRAMSELAEIELGPVVSVVPVLATEEAGGLTVGLIAATVHEAGLRLDLEVRAAPGTFDPGHMARVTVDDALGTGYRAAGRGSGGHPARYDVRIVPRPPATAVSLTVRIESFVDPFPGHTRRTDGPWTFAVPLRRGA
ncbi:MAG TPA: hypothetical protein VF494_05360 [Candidatus Limnocylindrales bacterium]